MTARFRWVRLLLSVAGLAPLAAAQEPDSDASVVGIAALAIDTAQPRVVKVYGATIGREPGYASGVIVGADGSIVTALSVLLEAQSLNVVLTDGRQFAARIEKRDERRQLALLQIDATDLPYFELTDSEHLLPGDWLLAAANPFKVAVGPEPVSVALGSFSGRTTLSARRRSQDFPYNGPVLLTDVVVATPGSAGGAVVDLRGRLVGVIGKAAISNLTNTWINYALPVEEVRAFVSGAPLTDPAVATHDPDALPDLGIRVFDVGGRARPAYIERIRPGSAARDSDLRPNDLILSLAGERIATCDDFEAVLSKLRPGQTIEIVVKRGELVLSVELVVGSRKR